MLSAVFRSGPMPPPPPQACYGSTGCQILDSLGLSYDALSCDDHRMRNTLVIFAIGVTFKLAYCIIFVRLSQSKTAPAPPPPRDAGVSVGVSEGKPQVKSEAQRALAAREQQKLEASGRASPEVTSSL